MKKTFFKDLWTEKYRFLETIVSKNENNKVIKRAFGEAITFELDCLKLYDLFQK